MEKTKKESVITCAVVDGVITWTVAGALPDGGPGVVALDVGKLSAPVIKVAVILGMKNRIGDLAALPKGTPPADKFAALCAGVTHYASGTETWELPRVNGVARVKGPTVVERAWVELMGGNVGDARAKIAALAAKRGIAPGAMEMQLAARDDFAGVIARLTGVSADDLDAELDALRDGDGDGDDEPATF